MIISDFKMHRISGCELLAVVRERYAHRPVMATSGEFWGGKLPAGVLADAYLEKGNYTTNQLCATIAGLVAASPIRPRPAVARASC